MDLATHTLLARIEELEAQVSYLLRDSDDIASMLNRRVSIENHLALAYQGKLRLPTKEDCKVLALRLGTPRKYWNDYLVNYKFTDEELH